MALCICESCGKKYDREKVAEEFDERHFVGSYDYCFPVNDYCSDCAESLYEEVEEGGLFSDGVSCAYCECSISGGLYTAPWEDGDNEYGYVICPSCGSKNFVE